MAGNNIICGSVGHDHSARTADHLVCVRCGCPRPAAPVAKRDALPFLRSKETMNPKSIT